MNPTRIDWQPIETASRDPQAALLLWERGDIYFGHWSPGYDRWVSSTSTIPHHPTHWAPMPNDPERPAEP